MFGTAFAQDAPPSDVRISFIADRAALTVGELVTLTLEVTYSADHVVVIPRLHPEWGPFEVRSQTPAQTFSNGDGTETTLQQLQVTLFAPGTFETPDLPLFVRGPDGNARRVLPASVQLTVRPVLFGPGEQLRDIRPPADLATQLWEQPTYRALAALVMLAALSVAGFFLYHRRSHRQAALPTLVTGTRMPWEVAIQELDRIERLKLPGDGQFKEHYTLVAEVMRAYLQAVCLRNVGQRDAIDMTTDEIGAAVLQSSFGYRNTRLVVDLLKESDRVKFANHTPTVSQAYEAARRVRNIVEETGPACEKVAPQDGAYGQREAPT